MDHYPSTEVIGFVAATLLVMLPWWLVMVLFIFGVWGMFTFDMLVVPTFQALRRRGRT